MVAASAALLLGGGGLIAVNVYANAEEGADQPPPQSAGQQVSTISCPDVANQLPDVPDAARGEVDRRLADLDTQITQAYDAFGRTQDKESVLPPLEEQRRGTLGEIGRSMEQAGARPDGLDGMAPCTLRAADQEQRPPQKGNGPEAADFVDITSIRPNAERPRERRGASRGTFTTQCGRNANGKFNPDNVIVAPGVSNGAHHMHDYVGNQATDAFSSDQDLANGRTSCRNQADKSTYYWPVLRLRNGKDENDAGADGGGKDQNVGEIQTPASVTLKFTGNPTGKVVAMPRFLRIITGDAKAFTNGDANANASWSCTGFENRQLKDKYPICPRGSDVVRTFRFQSCWDGRNTDSANHRTHVAFADPRTGACPQGFRAIPQLVQRIVYDVPPGPGFAVDSFPEQLHKPVTDHGDFINVFDQKLMRRVASCVNSGQRCA
ncbi:putative secreted protein [Streptomyces formicae]|uniref:Putative secreted protein n=2 Tax=Streptomyces formicae TaxID=1616117 RepID=A0A291Q609_9ACTN|nr:putative secreted protein [Streptomyces formicae]